MEKIYFEELTKEQIKKKLTNLYCRVEEIFIIERKKRKMEIENNIRLSLNNTICGKNKSFLDVSEDQYVDFEDFFYKWMIGMLKYAEEYQLRHNSNYILVDFMNANNECLEYVKLMLQQNYSKNKEYREKPKPPKELYDLYFGDNNHCFRILTTPKWDKRTRLNDNIVTYENILRNDTSEIPKCGFKFWTIGHILSTGIYRYNPYEKTNDLISFNYSLDAIVEFYGKFMSEMRQSEIEMKFFEKYLEYIKNSHDYVNEPFLIPQLRYCGPDDKCIFRNDFTILNSQANCYVSIELSPYYTHGGKEVEELLKFKVTKQKCDKFEENIKKIPENLKEKYSTFPA